MRIPLARVSLLLFMGSLACGVLRVPQDEAKVNSVAMQKAKNAGVVADVFAKAESAAAEAKINAKVGGSVQGVDVVTAPIVGAAMRADANKGPGALASSLMAGTETAKNDAETASRGAGPTAADKAKERATNNVVGMIKGAAAGL